MSNEIDPKDLESRKRFRNMIRQHNAGAEEIARGRRVTIIRIGLVVIAVCICIIFITLVRSYGG